MPNIVIASKDPLCQSAKNWFVKFQKCVETLSLENLGDNDTLYIIAHDGELKDGSGLINAIATSTANVPTTNYKVVLIVCSAASMLFSNDLMSPAERLANYFKRNVLASRTNVYGAWNDSGGAKFLGDYIVVKPGDDLLSLFSKMKVSDGASVPNHIVSGAAIASAAAGAANSGSAAGSGAAAAPPPSANGNGAAAAAAYKGASIQNHYKPNAGGNAGGAGGAGGAAPSDN